MKKLAIIGLVVISLFGLLFFLNHYQQTQKLNEGDNPYGTEDLSSATIDKIGNPDYENIILPDELDERLSNGETLTVYFFSPTCIHCENATPKLMNQANELDHEIVLYNLLEFEQGWAEYGIQGTPTLIHFENGEEVDRMSGDQPEGIFKDFIERNKE